MTGKDPKEKKSARKTGPGESPAAARKSKAPAAPAKKSEVPAAPAKKAPKKAPKKAAEAGSSSRAALFSWGGVPGEELERLPLAAALDRYRDEYLLANDTMLRDHTHVKIGGRALHFATATTVEILQNILMNAADDADMPLCVMGGGSKILFDDSGFAGLVLRLGGGAFSSVMPLEEDGVPLVAVGAHALLGRLVKYAEERNHAGFSDFVGIPATVGGAIAMNAGAMGSSISERVEEVTVMDLEGKVLTFGKPELRFGYRSFSLANPPRSGFPGSLGKERKKRVHFPPDGIVIGAKLNLGAKATRREIEKIREKNLKFRRDNQPKLPSLGSTFKNPPGGKSAGELLDLCGLKGLRFGGAEISPVHANFIVNLGNAGSSDVLGLIWSAKKEVMKKFGIDLEPEIVAFNKWGERHVF
ncbi:MAG: UDP-N-acetylmuramate dehydrogenase [Deltaproteobacteria bacterium]|nr:UDP-N-acetylmuramate dehydrogenase [Deltaproteobacteria bacterium]